VFFIRLSWLFVAKNKYMVKSHKKYTLLGGVKVSSQQLAEWGSTGGRPKKYATLAEKYRAYKLRKKQARLEPRKTYGEVKIKKYLTCSRCGKSDQDLWKYFNQKGEYIPTTCPALYNREIENKFTCLNCAHVFSFQTGEIEVQTTKTIIPRAGSNAERSQRSLAKKQKIKKRY
jgi:hypothetical protein